ncbi:hypothetical protein C8R44DRAFT_745757 [Mycena epipterygia]|nr:hypothetical protein C8R44DRAFT_745757 [Mycena epipterygia]
MCSILGSLKFQLEPRLERVDGGAVLLREDRKSSGASGLGLVWRLELSRLVFGSSNFQAEVGATQNAGHNPGCSQVRCKQFRSAPPEPRRTGLCLPSRPEVAHYTIHNTAACASSCRPVPAPSWGYYLMPTINCQPQPIDVPPPLYVPVFLPSVLSAILAGIDDAQNVNLR